MKTIQLSIFTLILLFAGFTSTAEVNIGCTPELKEVTDAWVAGYIKQNPGQTVNVQESINATLVNIVFENNETLSKNQWKMAIGHDAIVPVCSAAGNLVISGNKQGISRQQFSKIIGSATSTDNSPALSGHFFMLQDESIKTVVADFTGLTPELLAGTTVASMDELLAALKKDPEAFAFVSLHSVMENGSLKEGIAVIPIDKNGNGRLDSFENIYSGTDALLRGVYLGKFPSELSRSIYAVAGAKPTDKGTTGFLSWIMVNGQELLNDYGYAMLTGRQGKANVADLAEVNEEIATSSNPFSTAVIYALAIAGIVAIIVLFAISNIFSKRKAVAKTSRTSHHVHPLRHYELDVPLGLHYDKTHTWVFMEKDGVVRIGVDDFMQHITGKITRVVLKNEGDSVRKGENIMTIIKDGKQLNLKAPVTGIIRETNHELKKNPSAINYSPYSEGWAYTIVPLYWDSEWEYLFMPEKYKQWIKNEFSRLRDFLATTLQSNEAEFNKVVLQDGGEVIDGVLSELQPELWEEFQNRFIETSK